MEKKNILNLYPEDFENYSIWEDICDVLNMSYQSTGISVEFTNVSEKEGQ